MTFKSHFLNVALCATTAFLFFVTIHYLITVINFHMAAKKSNKSNSPPLAPHMIPLFGNLPLRFIWDAHKFVCSSRYAFGCSYPIRVKLMFQEFYIVQGASNVLALYKNPTLSAFFLHGYLLTHVFSLPSSAVSTYYRDNSGDIEKPFEDSSVDPHNRVEFLSRSTFLRLLSGPGYAPLRARFEHNIAQRLQSLSVSQDWTPIGNLMDIFHHQVTGAVIDSLCGTFLLNQHPEFTRDLWALDSNVTTFFVKTPRFLASGVYKNREKLRTWGQNFSPECVDADNDDPYWGTKFFRDRHDMFLKMDGFDVDAVASEELAFIWATNTNSIISAFWTTLEVFKDQQLLDQVRAEVESCKKADSTVDLRFDVSKLLTQPLLQSVYAETLRLRVNGFLLRRSDRTDLDINGWKIPKNRLCVTSSTPGHMDPNIWCTGTNMHHPTNEFWAGRFLKENRSTGEVEFSFKGTEGSWVPFGTGSHSCPGRNFAKVVALFVVAQMVSRYDCEVLADNASMKMGSKSVGFGTLRPVGKIPVRIRRRPA
ncbi:cytochrome P450 [Mollisia scopiformis]|uniref:Cytochrome P450 n=1 Tax=Mollisia scopiformis TaxID=149040 RepID=A0A194XWA9_MOLSC|nr:cytochrome P450 [Mollisia scopiformis]KUJ24523.1 cytochrome P450 [Mollisia scopiformis]